MYRSKKEEDGKQDLTVLEHIYKIHCERFLRPIRIETIPRIPC